MQDAWQDEASDCDKKAPLDSGDGTVGAGQRAAETQTAVAMAGRSTQVAEAVERRAEGESATTSYTLHSSIHARTCVFLLCAQKTSVVSGHTLHTRGTRVACRYSCSLRAH